MHSVSAVGTDLVVIGGATGANPWHAITTLVDNWRYNTTAGSWSRLADLPLASSNFNGNNQVCYERRAVKSLSCSPFCLARRITGGIYRGVYKIKNETTTRG